MFQVQYIIRYSRNVLYSNLQLVSCWTYLLLSDFNFPEIYMVYINFSNSSHCITVLSLSWLKKKKNVFISLEGFKVRA